MARLHLSESLCFSNFLITQIQFSDNITPGNIWQVYNLVAAGLQSNWSPDGASL
jgi:hypothetical protein